MNISCYWRAASKPNWHKFNLQFILLSLHVIWNIWKHQQIPPKSEALSLKCNAFCESPTPFYRVCELFSVAVRCIFLRKHSWQCVFTQETSLLHGTKFPASYTHTHKEKKTPWNAQEVVKHDRRLCRHSPPLPANPPPPFSVATCLSDVFGLENLSLGTTALF